MRNSKLTEGFTKTLPYDWAFFCVLLVNTYMTNVVTSKLNVNERSRPKGGSEALFFFVCMTCCMVMSYSAFAENQAEQKKIGNAYSKAVRQKVVEVSAKSLVNRVGLDTSRYSIAVYDTHQLRPIPFQIDEYNVEGTPYFAKTRVPILGDEGKFDGDDRLLFMLEDAGEQMPLSVKHNSASLEEGEVLFEFKIGDATGTRYVYLLLDNPMRSSVDYIRYDPGTGLNETDFYSLSVNKKNLLEWTNLTYNSYEGPNQDSILDTLKLRISGRILLNMASLTLSNRNLKAKLLGYLDGPIRSIVQLKTSIVIAKIPVMNIQVQLHHYPRHIHAISRTKTPRVIPYLFRDPKISVSIDANNLKGSQLYTALSPLLPAKVDGYLSRDESYLLDNGVDKNHTWLLLRSPFNFQIMTSLDIRKSDQTPVRLLYQDDAKLKNKPERYVGQLPNFGYVIEQIPMESLYYLGVHVYFDDNSIPYDPVVYTEQVRLQPEVTVISFENKQ